VRRKEGRGGVGMRDSVRGGGIDVDGKGGGGGRGVGCGA